MQFRSGIANACAHPGWDPTLASMLQHAPFIIHDFSPVDSGYETAPQCVLIIGLQDIRGVEESGGGVEGIDGQSCSST